jgi:hypothetical protein
MDKPLLIAKQIFLKLGIKYKTVFKELQNMVKSKILIKDEWKRYSINPEYGDQLIEHGLKIKGLMKKPELIIFINNFNEIKEKIRVMEECLRGKT